MAGLVRTWAAAGGFHRARETMGGAQPAASAALRGMNKFGATMTKPGGAGDGVPLDSTMGQGWWPMCSIAGPCLCKNHTQHVRMQGGNTVSIICVCCTQIQTSSHMTRYGSGHTMLLFRTAVSGLGRCEASHGVHDPFSALGLLFTQPVMCSTLAYLTSSLQG